MDRSSAVLGDAILYLKYLQERVKVLEEQALKQDVQSVVVLEKKNSGEEEDYVDEGSSSNYNEKTNSVKAEIEARVSDRKILLKIQCEKRKGILVKILGQMEKMNLGVVNTSVAPFGSLALDITIIAEMEGEFSLQVNDVVAAIHSAIRATI